MPTNKTVSILGSVVAVAATSMIQGAAVAAPDASQSATVNKPNVVNEVTKVNNTPALNEAAKVNNTPRGNNTPATLKRIQAESLLRSFGTVTRNGSSPECTVQIKH